jgi:FdhE protein
MTDLERLLSTRTDLEPLRHAITKLLMATFADPGLPVPGLRPDEENTTFLLERIKEGWAQGMPAVRVIPPKLDPLRLWKRALALVACSESTNVSAKRLREFIGDDSAQVSILVQKALEDGASIAAHLQSNHLDGPFATSILRLTLLGELGDWSDRICEHLSEALWQNGNCLVCGALPGLGESRGLEQRRVLRCGRCGAGWPANRLRCPFCGEGDHHVLRVLSAEEDQGKYHLFLCEACDGRLKVITTLGALSPPGLILAEFAMLHLDFLEPQEIA